MTQENQRLLNWLENEKRKDSVEIDQYKNKIISQIKKIDRKELIPTPKKLTLWQKIKILFSGT